MVSESVAKHNRAALERAQSTPIKTIALSGGGAKGAVYPGVYRAFIEAGLLDDVESVNGASAGALSASLLAVGYPIKKRRSQILDINFSELKGGRINEAKPYALRFMSKTGKPLYETTRALLHQAVEDYFDKYLDASASDELKLLYHHIKDNKKYDLTFRDLALLHELDAAHFKNLTLSVTRISDGKLVYCNASNTPDLSVAKACRASASVPYVFEPVELEIDGEKALYVDGGLQDNLPIPESDRALADPSTLLCTLNSASKRSQMLGAMHQTHWSELFTEKEIGAIFDAFFLKLNGIQNPSDENVSQALNAAIEDLRREKWQADQSIEYINKLQELALCTLLEHRQALSSNAAIKDKLIASMFQKMKDLASDALKVERLKYTNWFLNFGLDWKGFKSEQTKKRDLYKSRSNALRTVAINTGHVGMLDFKRATRDVRLLDAVGYIDTLAYMTQYGTEVKHKAWVDGYADSAVEAIIPLYTALLKASGRSVERNYLLKKLEKEDSSINKLQEIKAYALECPKSLAAFVFSRIVEYKSNLISESQLFKEAYVKCFQEGGFISKISGKTFFRASSLKAHLDTMKMTNPKDFAQSTTEKQTKRRSSMVADAIYKACQNLKTFSDSNLPSSGLK